MRNTTKAVLCAAGFAAAMISLQASGQERQSVRLAGNIARVEGETLFVKTAQAERAVRIAPDARLLAVVKASLADVTPGAFIGVGAMPQADGSQKAIRVMIFAESMRGLGEGHRPWSRPGTTMTNATVDTTVSSVAGNVVAVKYKGGDKKIVIGSDAEILAFVASDRSELKPGASVAINGTAAADGAVEASSVTVGRGGASPN